MISEVIIHSFCCYYSGQVRIRTIKTCFLSPFFFWHSVLVPTSLFKLVYHLYHCWVGTAKKKKIKTFFLGVLLLLMSKCQYACTVKCLNRNWNWISVLLFLLSVCGYIPSDMQSFFFLLLIPSIIKESVCEAQIWFGSFLFA